MGQAGYNAAFADDEYDPSSGVTEAVRWLIVANAVVYILQLAVLGPTITEWFALTSGGFPARWWTVGTYMFTHAGFAHLATNMVMLWMFGPRVEQAFGTRSFTSFYLWCGLGGAVFHLLFVPAGAVVGASGAVVGVVLAYALRWPEDDVYLFGVIPMKARWLAVITIAFNVGMALANMTGMTNSSTAWMAHVGGLAFAWLYLYAPKTASLEQIRKHVTPAPDIADEPHPIPRAHKPRVRRREEQPPKTADEAVERSNALRNKQRLAASPREAMGLLPPVPPTGRRVEHVNALLEKISREGINSLTPAERKRLEELSRQLRDS